MTAFEKIGILASIIGIPLALILWILKPSKIWGFVKTVFIKPKSSKIIDLEEKGLIIENKELVNNEKLLKKQKWIYWPVVPTDSPNLIHANFIKYLIELSNIGLKINVFVFDYYYLLVKNKDEKQCQDEVKQFISSLRNMGLNQCSFKVLYESRIIKDKEGYSDISLSLLKYFGVLPKKKIDEIASYKSYMKDDTPFIRYIKPFFNMIYLANTSSRYGFTLSGLDEQSLWKVYQEYVGKDMNFKLTNLYIPTMKGVLTSETDVLDKINNISYCDSESDIKEKLIKAFSSVEDSSCVHYALKYLIFNYGQKVFVNNSNGQNLHYTDYNSFLTDFKANNFQANTLGTNLTPYFHKIFHR